MIISRPRFCSGCSDNLEPICRARLPAQYISFGAVAVGALCSNAALAPAKSSAWISLMVLL